MLTLGMAPNVLDPAEVAMLRPLLTAREVPRTTNEPSAPVSAGEAEGPMSLKHMHTQHDRRARLNTTAKKLKKHSQL